MTIPQMARTVFRMVFGKSYVPGYRRQDGTLVKAHIKTYQRKSKTGQMVTVREHEDARTKAQQTTGARRNAAPDQRGQDARHESPLQTDRPPLKTVEPPKPGELESWLHTIEQEPDIQQAMREVSAGTSTHHLYRQSDGTYDPERAKLHDSIIGAMFNPRAAAEPGQRPHAVILLGAPASGKTTALQPAAKELGVEFTVINADDVKDRLPEYNGRNAGLVHEESSDIAEGQLLPKALQANHHVLLDITGANGNKVKGMVERFHKMGYEISILYAHLPVEKSCARAVQRFRSSGRFVPPSYIAKTVDGRPEETYNELKQDPRVTHWRRYSTDVEQGEQAPLQEQGGEGHIAGGPSFGKSTDGCRSTLGASVSGLRQDGGNPERQDSASAGYPSHTAADLGPLHRAYQVRDSLLKALGILDFDLSSPDLGPAERGVLLAKRLAHLTDLDALTAKIAEAEARL